MKNDSHTAEIHHQYSTIEISSICISLPDFGVSLAIESFTLFGLGGKACSPISIFLDCWDPFTILDGELLVSLLDTASLLGGICPLYRRWDPDSSSYFLFLISYSHSFLRSTVSSRFSSKMVAVKRGLDLKSTLYRSTSFILSQFQSSRREGFTSTSPPNSSSLSSSIRIALEISLAAGLSAFNTIQQALMLRLPPQTTLLRRTSKVDVRFIIILRRRSDRQSDIGELSDEPFDVVSDDFVVFNRFCLLLTNSFLLPRLQPRLHDSLSNFGSGQLLLVELMPSVFEITIEAA